MVHELGRAGQRVCRRDDFWQANVGADSASGAATGLACLQAIFFFRIASPSPVPLTRIDCSDFRHGMGTPPSTTMHTVATVQQSGSSAGAIVESD